MGCDSSKSVVEPAKSETKPVPRAQPPKQEKNYKLSYFDLRGRGELTRLIFAASGTKYEDIRIKQENWSELKETFPLAQVPVLDVGNERIVQSIAIARYVAKETGLAGKTPLDQTKADVVVETVIDLVNDYSQELLPYKDDEEAKRKFIEEIAPKHLDKLEKLANLFNSNGFFVGDSLTWADLYVYEVVSYLIGLDENILNNYEKLMKNRETVGSQEKLAEYLKNRKVD